MTYHAAHAALMIRRASAILLAGHKQNKRRTAETLMRIAQKEYLRLHNDASLAEFLRPARVKIARPKQEKA
jgi:hypothetical protein